MVGIKKRILICSSRFIKVVAGSCSFMTRAVLLVVTAAGFLHRNFGTSVERHDF